MAKVCSSVYVDPRYGCNETAELNNPDRKFATINAALLKVHCSKRPSANSRWTCYLSPCSFEENVEAYPFIDIYGDSRTGTLIIGNLLLDRLTTITDQVEITELTIQGQIIKSNGSLGFASFFNMNLTTFNKSYCFYLAAGEVRIDSCMIQQTISARTKANFYFYWIDGSASLTINARNSRHERYFVKASTPNQTFSNVLMTNINGESNVNYQHNTFYNNFSRIFLGLLIPYDTQFAAGLFQSHSDTLQHHFNAGAGNGLLAPVAGQTYSTAFILTRKIAKAVDELEVHIHTPEVLGLPETTLNVFSSAHTVSSGPAKTKHVGWQNFKQIPEALRILDLVEGQPLTITVTDSNAERSMTGNASDGKLFAGRLALEILNVVGFASTGPLGPTIIIPENVGLVNVQQTPVVLQIPLSVNLTLGQQITFRFEVPGPVLIQAAPPIVNPPNTITETLADSMIPGTWSSIVYDILPIAPPMSLYPPATVGVVTGVSSVTFTLMAIGGNSTNTNYFWRGTSIPSRNSLFTPGFYVVSVPPGATTATIVAWGGGGAGGASVRNSSLNERSGGGGGSAGGFRLVNQPIGAGVTDFAITVGLGSTTLGIDGGATIVNLRNATINAGGGGAGQNGDLSTTVPAKGGFGGVVTYPLSFPFVNFTPVNGVAGGAAGEVVFGSNAPPVQNSLGFPGQTSGTGYLGGMGGNIQVYPPIESADGPGGGAGGYNGTGASAGSFSLNFVDPVTPWKVSDPGKPAAPQSGAGGAGAGPIRIDSITNGADGAVILTFN